jgi:hypothetical protein
MQQQLQCINCGSSYSFGQQFCANCGNTIHYECPRCHSQITPGARFCSQCAADLSSAFQQLSTPSPITFNVLPNPPINTFAGAAPPTFQNPPNNAFPVPPVNTFPNTPLGAYQNEPPANLFPNQNRAFLPDQEKQEYQQRQIELPVIEKKEERSNGMSSRPWLIALVITILIIIILFGVGTCYK